jgi:hypothetical protein
MELFRRIDAGEGVPATDGPTPAAALATPSRYGPWTMGRIDRGAKDG